MKHEMGSRERAFDKGILTITLPKVETVKKKQIKIKVT
jgi:HSP20 family molecular chaperone IbpA